MLTCVFHPIDPMRVIEANEAEQLLKTGVWFDCPTKAQAYKSKIEDEIKLESKEGASPPKTKRKGKKT